MALTDKLTAIADAIRAKTGSTTALTLDEMPSQIRNMTVSEELLPASEIPADIRPKILGVAARVNNAAYSHEDSIIFLTMADSHYPASQNTGFYDEETIKSTIQANQVAKALTYVLDIDFVAHLGDVSCGGSDTTPEMLQSQIEGFISYFKEANKNLPCFLAIGNHDAGIYYHDTMADGNVYTLPGDYLYNNFTKYAVNDGAIASGEGYGGYCYRDFENKKLRVIMLNTSEYLVYNQTDNATLGSQRAWLSNVLLDLNSKDNASEWSFIILSHYPADYGATMPLSQLLKAYVEGESITISLESGASTSFDFADNNSAKFIAQFHGHIHNFKYDQLSVYEDGVKVPYGAWRICVPNGQFNRENYYTTVGSYTDIDFSESTDYPKTEDTFEGTSFTVNVIVPSEEKIYSFCYGAGYNRTLEYDFTVHYDIIKNLTNIILSNTESSVKQNTAYSTTLVYDEENYYLDESTISVTMDGEDITSKAYSNGTINISDVTGNIVITANAIQIGNYTNLIPLSTTEMNGSEIYNSPYGYKTGYRRNSSDVEVAASNMCCTGYMPLSGANSNGDVIRIKNVTIAGGSTPYFATFSSTGIMNGSLSTSQLTNGGTNGKLSCVVRDDGVIEITVNNSNYYSMWLSCGVIDETSIITLNEEITSKPEEDTGEEEVVSYTITNNLTSVTTSNTSTSINAGESYSATLTPVDGYEISSYSVTMGDGDITDTAYADGVVNISPVTGNIVITAVATAVQSSSYTNQIPLSTTTMGGTEIYNSPYGYKTGTRINSSGAEVSVSNMCCTGYIPLGGDSSKGDVIRIKNVTVSGGATTYFIIYTNTGTISGSLDTSALTSGGSGSNLSCTIEDDVIVVTVTSNGHYAARLSCGVIDDNSIITVNEEIV